MKIPPAFKSLMHLISALKMQEKCHSRDTLTEAMARNLQSFRRHLLTTFFGLPLKFKKRSIVII